MLRDRVKATIDWLVRMATEPRTELTRWQRRARNAYDLGRFGARQLREDRAPLMAGALAFRTLFALLPVLVVVTVAVRAIKGGADFSLWTQEFLQFVGLYHWTVPGDGESNQALGTFITEKTTGLNLAALGWVGFTVLVYSAIGLIVTIENSFNVICRAPQGRSWTRRLPLYWTVLTMSPVLFATLLFLNQRFDQWAAEIEQWQTLLNGSRLMWSFLITWFSVFVIFLLVPNTSMSVRAAATGSLVSGILLEIGRHSLGAYLQNAFKLSELYGSLGLIPIFMFWVYLMWMAVLFGLQVTATLQALGGRRLEEMKQRGMDRIGLVDPASMISLMRLVADRFQEGSSTNLPDVSDALGIPEPVAQGMVDGLTREGFLHIVHQEDHTFTLAKPATEIPAEQLIDLGYRLADEGSTVQTTATVRMLRKAQMQSAAQLTLASVLD